MALAVHIQSLYFSKILASPFPFLDIVALSHLPFAITNLNNTEKVNERCRCRCPHSPSSQLSPFNSSPLSVKLMFLKLPQCFVRLWGGRPGGCRVCAQHFSRISVWGHAGMEIFTLQSAPALLRHGSASKLKLDTATRPLAELMKQYTVLQGKMWRRNREILFVTTAYLTGAYDVWKSWALSVTPICLQAHKNYAELAPWRLPLDKRKTALSRVAVQLFSEVKHVSVWQSKLLFLVCCSWYR